MLLVLLLLNIMSALCQYCTHFTY